MLLEKSRQGLQDEQNVLVAAARFAEEKKVGAFHDSDSPEFRQEVADHLKLIAEQVRVNAYVYEQVAEMEFLEVDRRVSENQQDVLVVSARFAKEKKAGVFRNSDSLKFRQGVFDHLKLIAGQVRVKVGVRPWLEEGAQKEMQEQGVDILDVDAFVEANYSTTIKSLETFGIDVATAPSMETVKDVLKTLTPEQIQEINGYEEPVLLLKPEISTKDLIAAFDNKKYFNKTYVTRNGIQFLEESSVQKGWQIVITEGISAPKFSESDDVKESFDKRFQNFFERGEKGLDIKGWFLLQIRRLEDLGRPVDDLYGVDLTWTISGIKQGLVAECYFAIDNRCFFLAGSSVDCVDGDARFRPMVTLGI